MRLRAHVARQGAENLRVRTELSEGGVGHVRWFDDGGDALEVIRRDEGPVDTSHVENAKQNLSEVATFQTDAVLALKALGFGKDVARHAVREAIEHDAPGDLEALIKAALKRCAAS
jgi:hypothetical protein